MAFREQGDQDLFNRFILTNYNLAQLAPYVVDSGRDVFNHVVF
jgi:hypothetical protein